MQVPFLDLSRTHEPIKSDLEQTFKRVLNESYFVYGHDVTVFERNFAEAHQTEYCVSIGNCTDALQLTLQALDIGQGDEVLVPAMTWITDAEVVSNLGAMPVFVDVDEGGLIDVSQIEANITPNTKAIIVVHLYGQLADMNDILSISKSHGLKVIEDCAQSTFAERNGQRAGTYGDASVFSFYPTKNLGALGDAGCLLTNDQALAQRIRKLANHGAADKHNHEFPGTNSRMDTLQAAILNLKLPHLESWNAQRQKAADYYSSALKDLDLGLPAKENHVFHVFSILTKHRNELKSYLKERGIQTQIHYPKAVPFTKAYAEFGLESEDFPQAFRLQNESLSLPLFPGITEEEQAYVIQTIKEFFRGRI